LVRDFARFMARRKGLSRDRAAAAVDGAIERLALGDVSRLLIGKLSRGYRQRVAIAQALPGNPELLGLAAPTSDRRGHIRALAGGRAVPVPSHILGELERVADRVAILLGGRLLGVRSRR